MSEIISELHDLSLPYGNNEVKHFCQTALVANAAALHPCQMAYPLIKRRRKELGLTLEDLADEIGVSVSQLSRFESGKREPRFAELQRIADRLGVPVADLTTATDNLVQISGLVGAGGLVETDVAQALGDDAGLVHLDIPLPNGAAAFEVYGDSMLPRYDPGDVVIVLPGHSPEEVVGQVALVVTEDGRRYIKRVLRGRERGRYTLESFNASPLENVLLIEVGRIYMTLPASQVRRTSAPKEIARRAKRKLDAAE